MSVYVCLCSSAHSHMSVDKGARSSGAEVIGSCEPQDIGAGNQILEAEPSFQSKLAVLYRRTTKKFLPINCMFHIYLLLHFIPKSRNMSLSLTNLRTLEFL